MEPAQPPADPSGSDLARVPTQRAVPERAAPAQPPGQTDPYGSTTVPAQRTAAGQGAETQGREQPASAPRRRRVLAVLAGVLAVLCLGGVTTAYVLYDNATAPDRSAPDVTVDNYLRALFVDRDDTKASLYVCDKAPNLDQIEALRAEVERREAQYHVAVHISWGSLKLSSNSGGQTVRTALTIASSADGHARSSRREAWQFDAVKEDGWRVCGARRIGA